MDDRNSDMMDYADADYLDIYANGPLKYRETSEKNATLRRQKMEQRKSDLLWSNFKSNLFLTRRFSVIFKIIISDIILDNCKKLEVMIIRIDNRDETF